jgi:hypothetical protein
LSVLPRIYLDCVFYVYPTRAAAKRGENAGGTGFIAARRICRREQTFLVSNRHVIKPMSEPHIRVNTRDGGSEVARIPKSWWRDHPEGDDISAAQVDLPVDKYQIAWVYENAFVTPKIIEDHNIGLGDNLVMLGRLSTHDGKLRNMPSARFGHISVLPAEPVENKFGHQQETFVAEYFTIAGYSGAPVFVYLPSTARSEIALMNSGLGPWLLGINRMHFQARESVENRNRTSTRGGSYVIHTGMSGVIPAWRISSLIATFDLPAMTDQSIGVGDHSG